MDFFLLLAGSGGIIGNRGQSNYACGNTYQNALARYRVSRGEKAHSLALGVVHQVGFVAERSKMMDDFTANGYTGITEAELHTILDSLCRAEFTRASIDDTLTITGLSTPAALRSLGIDDLPWLSKPLFRPMHQMDRVFEVTDLLNPSLTSVSLADKLEESKTCKEAADLIESGFVEKLAKTIFRPVQEIDASQSLSDYGVDSLVAVELRYWFVRETKCEISVFDILGSRTISELTFEVARQRDKGVD
jgi:acyl carrier protein